MLPAKKKRGAPKQVGCVRHGVCNFNADSDSKEPDAEPERPKKSAANGKRSKKVKEEQEQVDTAMGEEPEHAPEPAKKTKGRAKKVKEEMEEATMSAEPEPAKKARGRSKKVRECYDLVDVLLLSRRFVRSRKRRRRP